MNKDERWVVEQFDLATNRWRCYEGAKSSYGSYEEAEHNMGGPYFFTAGGFRIRRQEQQDPALFVTGTPVFVRGHISVVDSLDRNLTYHVEFPDGRGVWVSASVVFKDEGGTP